MNQGETGLRRRLADEITQADAPLLVAELFDTADAAAEAIIDLARKSCPGVVGTLIVRAGSGLVVGLHGHRDRVVVKVHRPHLASHVGAMTLAQQRLHQAGLPVPAPRLAHPVSLGRGVATVDEWRHQGNTFDVRPPLRRRALAQTCHAIVAALPPDHLASLAPSWTGRFMTPHSAIFDFEATANGAEWIDALADEALTTRRIALDRSIGHNVVMHTDLRPENVLLTEVDGDPFVSTIYDLDSLACDVEPWLVGGVARAFSTNWSQPDPMLPTVAEIRMFVADYEGARGDAFTADEWRLGAAGVTYALAYSARCEHALYPNGADARWGPGWRQLLRDWHSCQQP